MGPPEPVHQEQTIVPCECWTEDVEEAAYVSSQQNPQLYNTCHDPTSGSKLNLRFLGGCPTKDQKGRNLKFWFHCNFLFED
jgi:hypothetical protein